MNIFKKNNVEHAWQQWKDACVLWVPAMHASLDMIMVVCCGYVCMVVFELRMWMKVRRKRKENRMSSRVRVF